MEEVTIYKFQLDTIVDALRLTSNIHGCGKGITCFDRQVRQAKAYAENALAGRKGTKVKYM